jgi:hypothetical protein
MNRKYECGDFGGEMVAGRTPSSTDNNVFCFFFFFFARDKPSCCGEHEGTKLS